MQTNFSQPQTFNPADMAYKVLDNNQDEVLDTLNDEEDSELELLDLPPALQARVAREA